MIETPQILTTAPQHYASLHLVIPVAEIRTAMGPGIQEVAAALQAAGVPPTGPWFTHHFHRPIETFDYEICFPTATAIAPHGRVQPGLWAATRLARTVFHGNYSGLVQGWMEFQAWIREQGLTSREEFWEVYTVNPEDSKNPEDWRTELNWPLA